MLTLTYQQILQENRLLLSRSRNSIENFPHLLDPPFLNAAKHTKRIKKFFSSNLIYYKNKKDTRVRTQKK